MKCGIIGLPQVGKTSLFRILTHVAAEPSHRHAPAEHIGVATVRDERLSRLAKLFSPLKVTPATVEYVDVAAIGAETLKETAYLANLRMMDALAHVVRVFASETVPHVKGSLDPRRDIAAVELDLIVSDLGVVENRLAKLEKDRKKGKTAELDREQTLLERAQQWLETEKPLRDAEWTEQEEKELRGFSFLSQKPMLLVLNVGEEHAARMEEMLQSAGLDASRLSPHTQATVICGSLEAELAMMPETEAAEFARSYGLEGSGTERLTRATLDLLDLIVFFTVGEKECRAWPLRRGGTALQAAGVIHSDIEKHFIRAEVVAWDQLLEAGSLAAAKQRGVLRLEGKEYPVQDGEIVHIRHSG